MKYNKLVGVLVLMGFFVPQLGLAAESAGVRSSAGKKFCSNLDSYLQGSEKKQSALEADKDIKTAKRQAQLDAKRVEKDKKLADKRAEILLKQEAKFTRAVGKASTTEQKLAVQEFQTVVQAAVTARQTAMDAARTAHRTGVDTLVADRKTKTDAALATMKTAIQTAVDKAKADCAVTTNDPAIIKTTLQSAVKAAREAFRATVQVLGKVGDNVKTLNDTQKAAFDKANTDFKTAVNAAKVTLRTKLGIK